MTNNTFDEIRNQRPRRIATHPRPDVDALVSLWLAVRFLLRGKATEVVFPSPRVLQRRGDDYDCVVAMGCTHNPERLRFYIKPPAFDDRNQIGAARLVWEFSLGRGDPVGHLVDLITAVQGGDSIVRRASSPVYRASRESGLHAYFEGLKSGNASDHDLHRGVSAWLDRYDAELRAPSVVAADGIELAASLPNVPGTYALILRASAVRSVMIGRTGFLGKMDVRPGYYAYIGSALGGGGLRGRLRHHLTPTDQLQAKWQVDFLRLVCAVEEVWYAANPARLECPMADCVRSLPNAEVALPKFGASDCDCLTHLPYFTAKPSFEAFRGRVKKLRPGGCRVERLVVS